MNTKDLRAHIRTDSDAELSAYLAELNSLELHGPTIKIRLIARENAMVVAHVLVNRKAEKLLEARRATL